MPSINKSVGATRIIKSFNFIAPATQTTNIPLGHYVNEAGAWYFITVVRSSDLAEQTFTLSTSKLLSGQPEHQRSSIVGQDMDFTFKVVKSGSDLEFEVANSETSDLTFTYIRIRK